MDLEVVTVGTELLLGFTLDGNTAEIGRLLSEIGCNVVRSTSIPDDANAIRDAVAGGLSRTGMVVVTGGLGPTRDDITKQAVAELFGAPLELDGIYLEKLKKRFERFGKGSMPASNRCQAELPRGATALTNSRGTAPGLWLDGDLGTVVLLPGVPLEMAGLMESEVVPRLRQRMMTVAGRAAVTRSHTLRTTGISESQLAGDLGETEALLGDVMLAYLPGVDGVDLRLTIRGVPDAEAELALQRADGILRPILADRFYGCESITLAEVLIRRLSDVRMRLAVAESCTGGLIGARIAAVPGASNVFAGGIICYENASKVRDLGVSENLLVDAGAVSEQVARAMADGVCDRFGVDVGVAVTGIAGPGGGTREKPVGTVWLAAKAGPVTRAVGRWFPGERNEVRKRSAQAALDLVRGALGAN
jgi:nicotinamide-nucleotide amidase